MPQRPPYATAPQQTVIDFDAPPPKPRAAVPQEVAEPAPPDYSIAPAWIDTAGRTRTWALYNPHGTQLAEICTKRDANKLAALLSRSEEAGRGHSY